MSNIQLKDNENNHLFPITKSENVQFSTGETLDEKLANIKTTVIWEDIEDKPSIIKGVENHSISANTSSATAMYAFAEGENTKASGVGAHSEGVNTIASGPNSHAEGRGGTASGIGAHAEGYCTNANGEYSHAEGYMTSSTEYYSHSEGRETLASGKASHAEGTMCNASGETSHAEGTMTMADGIGSHSEGGLTFAMGMNAHSEGYMTSSFGLGAHSEGMSDPDLMPEDVNEEDLTSMTTHKAYGGGSHVEGISCIAGNEKIGEFELCGAHAEGMYCNANGKGSHAEGYKSVAHGMACHAEGMSMDDFAEYGYKHIAYGNGAHIEGLNCTAGNEIESEDDDFINMANHAEGIFTLANGGGSHSEGMMTESSGNASHAEGFSTKANGDYSHAEGYETQASGDYSHAQGYNTKATASYSHAEGHTCTASGSGAHAEGGLCTASGIDSHAEGNCTTSSGNASHAEGFLTEANGDYSHAQGVGATSNGYSQTAIGMYNVTQGTKNSKVVTDAAFIVGNGTSLSRSNAFRITWEGKVYSKGAYSTSGADYAEMFEWSDQNPNNEERYGYFVTFDKGTEKIRKATSQDKYILGIISTGTAVLGDNYDEEWKDKYVRDKWGRIQYTIEETTTENEDGTTTVISNEVPILNHKYDLNTEYVSRQNRKEWDAVGLLGKLLVYDDGTCTPGDFCVPNDDGIATKSENGYYVLSRESENIIKVLFK